jgi:hypothetical protein
MKAIDEDGGDCWRKWYKTRAEHLLCLSGPPPTNLCTDELTLTICCRYAECLLKNPRIVKYLNRNHSPELEQLRALVAQFETTCQATI